MYVFNHFKQNIFIHKLSSIILYLIFSQSKPITSFNACDYLIHPLNFCPFSIIFSSILGILRSMFSLDHRILNHVSWCLKDNRLIYTYEWFLFNFFCIKIFKINLFKLLLPHRLTRNSSTCHFHRNTIPSLLNQAIFVLLNIKFL